MMLLRNLLFIAALWVMAFPQNAAAQSAEDALVVNAIKAASQGNDNAISQALRSANSRAAKNTLSWYRFVTADNKSADSQIFYEIKNFVKANPDWPYMDTIRMSAEKNITAQVSDEELIEWFSHNQPVTPDGMRRYVDALMARNGGATAQKTLRDWWPSASLTREQQREFYGLYGRYIDRQSHAARFTRLVYDKKFDNASGIASILGTGYPELLAARRALMTNSGDVNAAVSGVPAALQNDEGLLFERLQWRRKNDLNAGAIEILNRAPRASAMVTPKDWWRERHIIIRRLIDEKKYSQAYSLAAGHKQVEGFPKAQAEWVSGWLALRFINEPWKAFEHFEALYKHVDTPISKARGAFWAGEASTALKHSEIAVQWYAVAARYPETFYGQMAAVKIGQAMALPSGTQGQLSLSEKQTYRGQDLVKATKWMAQANQKQYTGAFLLRLSKNAKSVMDYHYAILLAEDLGQRHIAIKIAQELQKEKNVTMGEYLYPIIPQDLKNVRDVEWAAVHAIIRQESRFEQNAVSHAGARGLMQLMPATAKETARRLGISHQTDWLTSRPDHNIQLGSTYLAQMIRRYDGNYAMAAAAYNAGPGRVDRWLKEYGDPRKGEIEFLDWAELIPIYETRNYVQRVLEAVVVYRHSLRNIQAKPTTPVHVLAP